MVKVLKYIIGIILTVVPCVVCDYIIQYPLYKFDARETPVYKALLLLALCGVAVVLIYGGGKVGSDYLDQIIYSILRSEYER